MRSTHVPKFVSELLAQRVPEGRGVHFEAKLVPQRDANMRVEWFKDQHPLQMGNSHTIIIPHSSPSPGSRYRPLHDFGYVALDITHTIPEDSGVYTCRASNPLGEAITQAVLHVDCEFSTEFCPHPYSQ
jgi:hypothetical protein